MDIFYPYFSNTRTPRHFLMHARSFVTLSQSKLVRSRAQSNIYQPQHTENNSSMVLNHPWYNMKTGRGKQRENMWRCDRLTWLIGGRFDDNVIAVLVIAPAEGRSKIVPSPGKLMCKPLNRPAIFWCFNFLFPKSEMDVILHNFSPAIDNETFEMWHTWENDAVIL